MGQWNKLTALKIAKAKRAGKYADGGGLILRVDKAGNKSFALLWTRDKVTRYMGLGRVADVPLESARKLAAAAREQIAAGVCPLTARRQVKSAFGVRTLSLMTFEQAFDRFFDGDDTTPGKAGSLKADVARDWRNSMRDYVFPVIGKTPVADVDVADVIRVLNGEPHRLWSIKRPTGSKVRGRIEAVLDWAENRKLRTGSNPAAWKRLEHDLEAYDKAGTTEHHAALPFVQIAALVATLRTIDHEWARTLEFIIRSGGRLDEVLYAPWSEWNDADRKANVWRVDASRMKMNAAHDIALTPRMLEILDGQPRDRKRVFETSGTTIRNHLARLNLKDELGRSITVHGFRATFSTWAQDVAHADPQEIDRAVAHKEKDSVRSAYQRSKLLDRRRPLMAAWNDYCDGRKAKLIKFRLAA